MRRQQIICMDERKCRMSMSVQCSPNLEKALNLKVSLEKAFENLPNALKSP